MFAQSMMGERVIGIKDTSRTTSTRISLMFNKEHHAGQREGWCEEKYFSASWLCDSECEWGEKAHCNSDLTIVLVSEESKRLSLANSRPVMRGQRHLDTSGFLRMRLLNVCLLGNLVVLVVLVL